MISVSHIRTVVNDFINTHRIDRSQVMSSIFYEDLTEEFAIHVSTEIGIAMTAHQVYQMTDDDYIDQILAAYAQANLSQ